MSRGRVTMFKTGPLFKPIWEFLHSDTHRILVLQGGTSSGKTYTTIQDLFLIATEDPGSIITVAGQDIPNLKKGAYRDAQNIFNNTPTLGAGAYAPNKTDRIFQFKNKSVMEFNAYEDEQDAKSGKRHYLFVNEANGLDYMVFWQLAIRTQKKIIIDYNPNARFWAHEKLLGEPDVKLIISDHRHNPFLTKEDHYKIENIKDPDLWKVYARGMTGNLIGTIFPNWTCIPDSQFPEVDGVFWGLDLGYTNDPTALIKIARVADSIFLHECCYEAGIAPIRLKEIAAANGYDADQVIYHEHDVDSIVPLRRLGMRCLPARKGPGSIKAGIAKLKEFKVFYTASSKNLKEEVAKYQWQMGPDGKPTNTPIDKFNHALDAARYGVYTHYFRG